MKTNKEIELQVQEVLDKYLKKGGCHKILLDIINEENIKYNEVDVKNDEFVGAFTKGNNEQLYIAINNNIDNIGRKNFTIAHELGHYFLKHELNNNSYYCLESAITEDNEAIDSKEQEANHFATCLLMPEQKIKSAFLSMLANSKKAKVKGFLCVKNDYTYSIWAGIRDDLIKRYGVSESALRYRLTKLNLTKFEIK